MMHALNTRPTIPYYYRHAENTILKKNDFFGWQAYSLLPGVIYRYAEMPHTNQGMQLHIPALLKLCYNPRNKAVL